MHAEFIGKPSKSFWDISVKVKCMVVSKKRQVNFYWYKDWSKTKENVAIIQQLMSSLWSEVMGSK